MTIFERICSAKGQVALLIDPEKTSDHAHLKILIDKAEIAGIHYFFVGGSTVLRKDIESTVAFLKAHSPLPVILFPGASHQFSPLADAVLFLNLISGRNPDFLIGHQVQSAEEIWSSDVETIATGYILIDGGKLTSVAYVSQTTPIPRNEWSIARKTAIAGHLMGQQLFYFDAGSGALQTVPAPLIQLVNQTISAPLIVGGGIRTIEEMEALSAAGTNVIVIGTKIEEDIDFLLEIRAFTGKSSVTAS